MPEACPECGKLRQYVRLRCQECKVTKLDDAMQSTAGRLLSHAADLNMMLHKHFNISPADIDAEEFAALKILWDEQGKWEKEEQRIRQREQAFERGGGGGGGKRRDTIN